ncbi:MAG: MCP four helix bundle domain-containing protein [Burkholderiales bacterium]
MSLAFGVIIAFMIGAVSLSLFDLAIIDHHIDDIVTDHNVKIRLNNAMSEGVHVAARVTRTLVLLHDDGEIEREAQKIATARKVYDEAWQALQKFPASDKDKALRAKIDQAKDEAREANDKVIGLAKAHKDEEAIALLLKHAGPLTQKWQGTIDENLDYQEEANKQAYEVTQATYNKAQLILIVVTALAVTGAAVLGWLVTRGIVVPAGRLQEAMMAYAKPVTCRSVRK